MVTMPEISHKKATQALNFLARKKDGKINKMKAIKLIYLADRLHLRKYGRPIVGDNYLAMKFGPVGSQTKNIAELSHIPSETFLYAKKYIKPVIVLKKNDSFVSLNKEDLNVFSDTDIECLETVYDKFSDKDQFELAEMIHEKYPEWPKYERKLKTGKRSVKMDYNDLFVDGPKDEELFKQSKSELSFAKESFKELKAISSFFSE
ncbi:Panacea domain-containing protein [Patescibacteria group bacterium]